MTAPPPPTVAIINGSLRCFTFGLLSFIPIIGLIFAALAWRDWWRVEWKMNGVWNPARRFLHWGYGCALAGGLMSLGAALWVGLLAFQSLGFFLIFLERASDGGIEP